jgi:hypothetical protein
MNTCQVCGRYSAHGSLNCWEHAYVRQSMVLLAQDIYNLDASIDIGEIKELAVRHNCCEATVKNHLKRQGFRMIKGWERRK